jgi:UDP-2,3-diacylglucosamine pyrophosphatase LpxH
MNKFDQIDDTVYSYATLRQQEVIDAVNECGGIQQKAAKKLGISHQAVSDSLIKAINNAAKKHGYSPSHDLTKPTPVGVPFSGASTLYRLKARDDDSVGTVMQWVKSNVALGEQFNAANKLLEALINEIKPLPLIKYRNKPQSSNRFTCIPIGDPHIGLLVWAKETGEDWNLEIAERVYTKVFKRLLSALPDTEECILVNTGDAFHADNAAGRSTRSGHSFDLDGRYGKWIDAGYLLMRMFTDLCLKKYKKVEFINVPGNHDDVLGMTIGKMIRQVYSENPRVTVQVGDNPFQYVHRENVLLGFAHGHTCKLPSLPGKMADDMYKLWGNSTYRHWITGHVHHKSWIQFKEHPGCKVETVGIIPPKDAYSHGGGYGAGRGIQGLIFDKKIGYLPLRVEENVRATD